MSAVADLPAPAAGLLPAALAEQLTDEQRQALAEAPRGQRLAVLATALARPEAEVLTALAAACSLDVASNLEADAEARGLLPARLVHEYQIIPLQLARAGSTPPVPLPDLDRPLHLAAAWPPDADMAAWIRTFTAASAACGTSRSPSACTS